MTIALATVGRSRQARSRRRLTLACYDIGHRGRLRLALKVARHFATGGQLSAYECFVARGERALLVRGLRVCVGDGTADSVAVIRTDPRRPVLTAGMASPPDDPPYFLVT